MIALLAASLCLATSMENKTKYAWNNFDMKSLKTAQKRCPQLYPDEPCVKRFIKYNKQDYSVVCGSKIK